MMTNPALGVLRHAIWRVCCREFPRVAQEGRAVITIPDRMRVLAESPGRAWWLCLRFGMLWGLGNLTLGLSVRYLGRGLGYAVPLREEMEIE
jgi:hypothetical protein